MIDDFESWSSRVNNVFRTRRCQILWGKQDVFELIL